MQTGGRSMIVDPWGVVLAQAPDAECASSPTSTSAGSSEIRTKLPSLANRRASAYRRPQEAHA